MVLNIGRLISGDLSYVENDIAAVCAVARQRGMLIKVIFETFYLDQAQKIQACEICSRVGVDFVKTSTGFAGGGATVDDIHLMRTHCPPAVSVKASGGIRDLDAALAVIACGARRIGTSSTEKNHPGGTAARSCRTIAADESGRCAAGAVNKDAPKFIRRL